MIISSINQIEPPEDNRMQLKLRILDALK